MRWYGLGVVQTIRGMPDEAITAFENSYRINPNHGPTIANLAVLLENLNPERVETRHRGNCNIRENTSIGGNRKWF